MDVARYGDFAENKRYIKETTGQFYSRRFVMTYPNEQLPAGPAAEDGAGAFDMTAAGLPLGRELGAGGAALLRADEGFEEKPTLKRSNAHDIVARNARRCARRWGCSISPASRASR
jgi:dimethylglycine dehydrogenase